MRLVAAVGLLCLITISSGGWAQSAAAQPSAQGALNYPSDAMAGYRTVDAWIQNDWTAGQADAPKWCAGVWMAVRWAGREMATAQETDPMEDSASEIDMLGRVARQVFASALEQAGHNPNTNVQLDPVEKSQRVADFRSSQFVNLQMQFAINPRRIRVTKYEDLLKSFELGINGLIIRTGDRKYHAVFPGEMLMNRQKPDTALFALLAKADIDMSAINKQLTDGELRVWLFDVIDLAQPGRGQPPAFLTRGWQAVSLSDVDSARIHAAAHDLADYLMRTTWSPPARSGHEGAVPGKAPMLYLSGNYETGLGRFTQPVAPSDDAALAAFALWRYGTGGALTSQESDRCCSTARSLLRGLADLSASNQPFGTLVPGGAAMIVRLMDEMNQSPGGISEFAALRTSALSTIQSAYDPQQGFADGISPESRALIAFAMRDPVAIKAAWDQTGAPVRQLLLPWLSWAVDDVSSGAQQDGGAERRGAGVDPEVIAGLADLKARLTLSQLGHDPLQPVADDLIGAIPARDQSGYPDWESARYLALIATAPPPSADGASAAGRAGQEARLSNVFIALGAARFTIQLMIGPVDRYRVCDFDRAKGGVRLNPVNQTVSPGATGMSLLGMTQMIRLIGG